MLPYTKIRHVFSSAFFWQYDQHLFRGKQPPIIAHNKITHTHTHIFLQTNKTHFQSLSYAKYDVRPCTDWQGYTTALKGTDFAFFTILSCPAPSNNLITFKFVLVYRLPFIPLFGFYIPLIVDFIIMVRFKMYVC